MRTVTYRLVDLNRAIIPLGFVGENNYTRILIDAKRVFDEYPFAIPSLTVQPPQGESYPAVVVRDGDIVSWDVSDSDLVYDGYGELQLAFMQDEVKLRTFIAKTRISKSIVPTGEIPEPIEDFLQEASAAVSAIPQTINTALAEAKASGEFDGKDGEDGKDGRDGIDGRNGVDGRDGINGVDGYSPSASVTKVGNTATITITDKLGTTTTTITDGQNGAPGRDGTNGIDGRDGIDGFSPSATVTKSGNTATISITDKDGTTDVTITDGQNGAPGVDGQDGADGADGFSPSATITKSGSVATISITDKTGTTTATISDGQNGENGQDGEDGYSPSATVIKSGDTATITITDKNGTTTTTISDGQDGQPGADGEDGFSPSASVSKSGAVATISITDKNGTTTAQISDGIPVIDDTSTAADKVWSANKVTSELSNKLNSNLKGAVNGIAELNDEGKVPSSQLPSYVDDVLEYDSLSVFPQTGETGKIYVAKDTNKTYRWSGSGYTEISESLALGETSSTAYRGDRGATAYAAAVTNVETIPTENSSNLITSGAVYTGLAGKANTSDIPSVPVQDVQIDSASIVVNNVAAIPTATDSVAGVIKLGSGLINNNGLVSPNTATALQIKTGTASTRPITPYNQHQSVFYGLAKIAGADEKDSFLTTGTYSDTAKTAIKSLIGVSEPTSIIDDTAGTGDTTKVWSADKNTSEISTLNTAIGAKYTVPSGGIPSTDMTSGVQSSLNLADTAYQKPQGGIPAADIASGVIPSVPVQDVQINGTSIINNGVANIPYGSASTAGVVSNGGMGVGINSAGEIYINYATESAIKTGTTQYNPITPKYQQDSVFYGLAKAAGDATQSASSNTVGTYTSDAKSAIRTMLDVPSTSDIPTVPVQDIQVNSTSILNNGVANIPLASTSDPGVVIVGSGLEINSSNKIYVRAASSDQIKVGIETNRPITPAYQEESVFYGLAKAAGDMTQPASLNTVGTYTADAKTAIQTMLGVPSTSDIPSVPVQDIQINNTSILSNGVANIPYAYSNTAGVIKIGNGLTIDSDGQMFINKALDDAIKAGTNGYNPITPVKQHISTFYGLAKAAGDATQTASSNPIGTYTEAARIAILKMLGIYEAPWELIREDTFTNTEEAEHVITVDGNGNAFELTDVILQVTIPKDVEVNIGNYGMIDFYYGTSSSAYKSAMLNGRTGTKSNVWYGSAGIIQESGAIHIYSTAYSESGNNRTILIRNQQDIELFANFSVSKIKFRPLTGTLSYKLYGKRKWTT